MLCALRRTLGWRGVAPLSSWPAPLPSLPAAGSLGGAGPCCLPARASGSNCSTSSLGRWPMRWSASGESPAHAEALWPQPVCSSPWSWSPPSPVGLQSWSRWSQAEWDVAPPHSRGSDCEDRLPGIEMCEGAGGTQCRPSTCSPRAGERFCATCLGAALAVPCGHRGPEGLRCVLTCCSAWQDWN